MTPQVQAQAQGLKCPIDPQRMQDISSPLSLSQALNAYRYRLATVGWQCEDADGGRRAACFLCCSLLGVGVFGSSGEVLGIVR
jgi:hypothetical protein